MRVALVTAFCALLAGCAGYQLGTGTLYRPGIRSIHVPIFESDSFRRHLGERLTEAVVKEIEAHTPYKVTSAVEADSTLTGRILRDSKKAVFENRNDEPRDILSQTEVQVIWQDRHGAIIGHPFGVPLSAAAVNIVGAADFVPESGQSVTTGQQETIERLAKQIVEQLEVPW